MKVALKEDLAGMGGWEDVSQGWSARKKMMTAVEWGNSYSLVSLLSHHGKLLVHPCHTL
jgi:hypothetical protein